MIQNMKPKHRSVGPNMPMTTDALRDDLERIASYPSGHEVRTDSNGTIHIFRRRESGGTADTRPSKLREAQERINQRNSEREGLAAYNQRNREHYDKQYRGE